MKYLPIIILTVFLYACGKDKTPAEPANPVPDSLLHKFTGTYKLFDSSYGTKNNTFPPWPDNTVYYSINKEVVITIDSFRKELRYAHYVYKGDSTLKYFNCFNNDPLFTYHTLRIVQDSIFINHWGQIPGHASRTSDIRGYRIK